MRSVLFRPLTSRQDQQAQPSTRFSLALASHRGIATGALPSSDATLVGVGAVAEAPTGTGILIADVAVLAGDGEVTTPAVEATGTGTLVPSSSTRTNLATHSQNILTSGTSWFGGAITATSNSTTAADGTLTAERLADNASPATCIRWCNSACRRRSARLTRSRFTSRPARCRGFSYKRRQMPRSATSTSKFSYTTGALGQKSANCTTKIEADTDQRISSAAR